MLELVDTFTGDRGLHIPRPLVRLAVQFLRMSIKRKARFDIYELDVITAARQSFVPALFGHAKGDKFILPHHTEDIYAVYPVGGACYRDLVFVWCWLSVPALPLRELSPAHSQGDKNIITFEGGHNTVRSQFFFDSVSIFFLNTLHPPGAPVPSPAVQRGPDEPEGGFQPISVRPERAVANAPRCADSAPERRLLLRSMPEAPVNRAC